MSNLYSLSLLSLLAGAHAQAPAHQGAELSASRAIPAGELAPSLDKQADLRIKPAPLIRLRDWLRPPPKPTADSSESKLFIQRTPSTGQARGAKGELGATLFVQVDRAHFRDAVPTKSSRSVARKSIDLRIPETNASLTLKPAPRHLLPKSLIPRDIELFSAPISVQDREILTLAKEVAAIKDRRFVEFKPGTREVLRVSEIPDFDVKAFMAGKRVELPRFDLIKPLKSLGSSGTAINPQKSLIITSLPVLEDPARTVNPCASVASNNAEKVWTFGHLMTQMAQGSGTSPEAFTEAWLEHWRSEQLVFDSSGSTLVDATSDVAQANLDNMILNPWKARSPLGNLDLNFAPFRLQAILYRPDLATSNPYGGQGGNNGGELRFVFGMMEVRDVNGDGDALDSGDTCRPIESAVIFEYGVPLHSCSAIKAWANRWVDLSALLPGTPAYANALEDLTQEVVLHGAAPNRPNQNAINQVRTNEIDLSHVWQFREFILDGDSGQLQQTTVKNNPREHAFAATATSNTPTSINLNGSDLLFDVISNNVTAINNSQFSFPETFAGEPFIGGSSSYSFGTFWDHPALSTPNELEARFKFSLGTCSGCHTGETDTIFYHIRPTAPGTPPDLSEFLTNNNLTVTDNRGIDHEFAEMDFRKQHLASLANQSCGFKLPPFHVLRKALVSPH